MLMMLFRWLYLRTGRHFLLTLRRYFYKNIILCKSMNELISEMFSKANIYHLFLLISIDLKSFKTFCGVFIGPSNDIWSCFQKGLFLFFFFSHFISQNQIQRCTVIWETNHFSLIFPDNCGRLWSMYSVTTSGLASEKSPGPLCQAVVNKTFVFESVFMQRKDEEIF